MATVLEALKIRRTEAADPVAREQASKRHIAAPESWLLGKPGYRVAIVEALRQLMAPSAPARHPIWFTPSDEESEIDST